MPTLLEQTLDTHGPLDREAADVWERYRVIREAYRDALKAMGRLSQGAEFQENSAAHYFEDLHVSTACSFSEENRR